MTLFDVNEATSLVYDEAGSDANIIFGAVIDPEMEDQMRVTVIATGIGQKEAAARKEMEQVEKTVPGQPISEAVIVASLGPFCVTLGLSRPSKNQDDLFVGVSGFTHRWVLPASLLGTLHQARAEVRTR